MDTNMDLAVMDQAAINSVVADPGLGVVFHDKNVKIQLFPGFGVFIDDKNHTEDFATLLSIDLCNKLSHNVKKAIEHDVVRSVLENVENHVIITYLINDNIRKAINDYRIIDTLEDDKSHDVIPHLRNDNIRKAIEHDELRSVLRDDENHDIIPHLSNENIRKAISNHKIRELLMKDFLAEALEKDEKDGDQVFGIIITNKDAKDKIDAELKKT